MYEKVIVKPDAKTIQRTSQAGKQYQLQDQVHQLFNDKDEIQAMTQGQYFVTEPLAPGEYRVDLSMVYDRDGKIETNKGEPIPLRKPKAA
jgi:hypothetical protein